MPKEKSKIQLADFELNEDSQSLYKAVKDNPKDKIEVELGDSKDNKGFYPQAKIQRWDNEVNFSLRYKEDSSKEAKVVEVKDDVLVWSKGQKEVHIYEKPDIAEDGGLEIEVVLKEKPISNVVEFSIETKGLDFFYQPELTAKEIKDGATRPENVVGSYAVYHSTKRDNFPDKEYKTGKAFHIFRPKVTDSSGSEIWGELNIDVEDKLLTVIIDEKWLDKAVYPVVVDPTFGYTSNGASWTTLNNPYGSKFSSPSDLGSVTDIACYVKFTGGPPSDTIKMGIWKSSDLTNITNSLTSSITVNSTTASWKTHTYGTAPTLSASTDYFLTTGTLQYNCVALGYDAGGSNQGIHPTTETSISAHNWNSLYVVYDNNKYCLYVTYTAGGGTEANAERNIYLSGKSTGNGERNLYLSGKVLANAERNIYLSGKGSGNSERGLYLTGVDSSFGERGLYLSGKDTSYSDVSLYLEGSVASIYSRENSDTLGTDDTLLSTVFIEQDYTDVADDDDTNVDLLGTEQYNIFLFKVHNENNTEEPFVITWKGLSTLASSDSDILLQIYNRTTDEWETIDTESSANANTEFTLSAGISTSLSDYYDNDYLISCRVYQEV